MDRENALFLMGGKQQTVQFIKKKTREEYRLP